MAESQRWRLLGAAAEVVAERGYAQTKVSDIASRGGVSRGTFYEQFADLSACLLATYEMVADCVCDLAEPTPSREAAPPLQAVLEEILRFLAEEPTLAHLLGTGLPAGVPEIAAARERLIDRLAEMGAERHSLEGAFALVYERVAAGEAASLPQLAPQLAELIGCRRA